MDTNHIFRDCLYDANSVASSEGCAALLRHVAVGFITMRRLGIAAIVTVMAYSAGPAANASNARSGVPTLQPFECNSTESMNVASFVPVPTNDEALMLETVLHGDTCGYEGGVFAGVAGTTITHLNLQVYGTNDKTGFGPYLEIFYNGGNSVNVLPIKSAHFLGMDGPYFASYEFLESQFGLPAGAVISGMQIIANPTTAEDGKCFIRQVRINNRLLDYIPTVINACP